MESLEQTAEERHVWNYTGWKTPGVKVRFFSTSAVVNYGDRVYLYLYNHNSATLTSHLDLPELQLVYKHNTFPSVTQKQVITTAREVSNVIHYSEQSADTCLILKTSFCASLFFPQGLK